MRGFSAIVNVVGIALQLLLEWLQHKRKLEQEKQDDAIRTDPAGSWASRFGRVREHSEPDQPAEQLPPADTGTTGSGRRWDGEPGPE